MRSETSALFASLSPNAGVCVADGFGIRLFVRRRHLVVQDGLGSHRRERAFARATAGIKRLIVLGHEGFVTLEALRWMADLGIAFIQIDRDGKLVAASAPPGNDDARLRRSQALARETEAGLKVARWILKLKLRGQHDLLAKLNVPDARQAVKVALRELKQTASTDDLMSTPEARAAAAYWDAWASLPIQFVRADAGKVPEHWRCFGPRRSPVSGSPRLAANPANAILNYLYRLLEAETRLACVAVGLDPGLGFFHRDKRGRDNLVMDVMEACRPQVDTYALHLFQAQLFRAADFHETRKGVCRVLPPLTYQLAEAALIWSRAVAPVAETVARMLGKPRRMRPDRPPTPLTGRNRSEGRDAVRRRALAVQAVQAPRPPRRCRECGVPVPSRTKKYCEDCLRKGLTRSANGSARLKKAAAMTRHQEDIARWRDQGSVDPEPRAFSEDVLPGLQRVPVRSMMAATGLSEAYCYRIRRGEITPHPRHWQTLQSLAEAELRPDCSPPPPDTA
jgi:CRISPR-associated endonuclease Cas1